MNKETSKYVQTAMHLYCDKTGEPLISVFGDGSVDISADVTLDEAATAFWNAVRKIFDRHVTPASETELRAIHATAVADVMTADKTLQPEVDGWWQLYLRSVLSQSSRPWFTSTAKDDELDDEIPDAYQYKYPQPTGNTVWRDSPSTWNGQQPSGSRGLFARPYGKDLRQKLKDAQFAVDALNVVGHALGLPPGSNVTTDVVQAALDAQLEATGRANMVIVDLVNGMRDVLSRHRITVAAEPTLHESIDAADAFLFSRDPAAPAVDKSAEADTERLDWLDRESNSSFYFDQATLTFPYPEDAGDAVRTLRDLIDQARRRLGGDVA